MEGLWTLIVTIPFSLYNCWLNKHSLVVYLSVLRPYIHWCRPALMWTALTHSLYSIHTKPATRSNKIPLSLHKTFPMKTLPLLLWSWLGVVSMVKAVKVSVPKVIFLQAAEFNYIKNQINQNKRIIKIDLLFYILKWKKWEGFGWFLT